MIPSPTLLRDLGGRLILRRAAPADAEALIAFNAITHSDTSEPDPFVAGHTSDLIHGRLPTFQPGDFTIVEESASGRIVSSLSLISQVWAYEGISFAVGRPEIVGTAPDYRRRGLVRAQFEVVHGWSQTRGELAQVITGNPWYYRQFGYELALAHGGSRSGAGQHIPRLPEGQPEPYVVRPAGPADLGFIAGLYELAARRQPIHCLRSPELWRFELDGRHAMNLNRRALYIVQRPGADSAPLGYFALAPWPGTSVYLSAYEILPGESWLEVTPSVLRAIWSIGKEKATDPRQPCESFTLALGAEHPVYPLFPARLPAIRKPGAWYVRVPDLPAFIRHVSPALERRLAQSDAAQYTGELRVSFYRSGLRLGLQRGRLTLVEPWCPTQTEWGEAAFPGLTFSQLLFGFRRLDELEYAFPDCWAASDAVRAVLNGLFPQKHSHVWGVG